MATAVESPSQLCMCAEQALLLSDYSGTVAYAQRCLASGSIDTPVKERALVAALQALFEQGRASAARRLLSDCYPCLEDVPPNALLLWLALAVDSEHAEEAKQAMRALLSSCQPGSAAGWRRAQYLSLLHLYVHEALQPERRDAAGKQGSRGAYTVAHFSPDPAQLAGGTVLGAVLLYALYVEQQSIRRGARWARQAVASGAVQLLRMAFSLSINPVATSAPAWR
ncbi:hypothetical protein C2E21_7257 [Chlorella sorokiniana]|uniref:Uncharacterized protein n=1 Tax=Chlorella sorokiniana TaxID=3076 RepID=A0A2P6TI86_CHLSO|nr:hypothetical protein C2E21_7257 [Chlorella sorokiniana]|eukprot:PRW34005.1 hypothetical protein C2E21_7257 [Chlorella sorokiniana]